VPDYLSDMALVWFENQDFLSWTIFVNEFKKYYADESQRSCQAAEELRSRAQRQGETCHDYVQAVLQLCRESDATMTEAQRVGHVLKGIAETVFYLLYQQNFTTVAEILEYCRKLDQTLSRRVLTNTLLFPRLSNTLTNPVYPTSGSISAHLETRHSPPTTTSAVSVPEEDRLTAIVEKVVAKAIDKLVATPSSNSVVAASTAQRDQRQCYYCGRLGHVQRFCRTRQRDRQNGHFYANRTRFPNTSFPTSMTSSPRQFAHQPDVPQHTFSAGRFRSPSPGPRGRSPTTRQRSRSGTPTGNRI